MFTPIIRILLVVFSLVLAYLFYNKNEYLNMGMMLVAGLLFVYGYYRYGTVFTAFQQIKKQNYNKAESLLSKIKNPESLSKSHKSYYHLSKGMIASNKNNWEESYSELNTALNLGLRTKNDTSIVLLNLAQIRFEQKDYSQANAYLEKVGLFELKPLVKSEVDKLQSDINVAQQRV